MRGAVRAVEEAGSQAGAAELLGISRPALQNRLRQAKTHLKIEPDGSGVAEGDEGLTDKENSEKGERSVTSRVILAEGEVGVRSLEELLEAVNADEEVWEVREWEANSWPVAGKRRKGRDEEVFGLTLFQVKAKLKRKVDRAIVTAGGYLADKIKPTPRRTKKLPKPRRDGQLLMINLYDAHIGAYGWAPETMGNWDTEKARARVIDAVDEILTEASHYPIDRILIPIGNDFVHIDNTRGETAKGTRLDFDTRYAKVIVTAHEVLEHIAERAVEMGVPVEFVFVPGNHDRHASFHLVHWLKARYASEPLIEVDVSPTKRKYRRYGVNAFQLSHGELEKKDRLPRIFAEEFGPALEDPAAWGETRNRESHVGHVHQRQKDRYPLETPFNGVTVIVNPALCNLDAYHFEQGFIGGPPAADAYRYDLFNGRVGMHTAYAKDDTGIWNR